MVYSVPIYSEIGEELDWIELVPIKNVMYSLSWLLLLMIPFLDRREGMLGVTYCGKKCLDPVYLAVFLG